MGGAEESRRRPVENRAVCIEGSVARVAKPSVDSKISKVSKVLVPLSTLRPLTTFAGTFAGTRFVLVDV